MPVARALLSFGHAPGPNEETALSKCKAEHQEGLAGRYANHFRLGFNMVEFVIDFCQQYEGDGEASCHTRIVVAPEYARELTRLLQESLEMYRRRYQEG